MYKDNDKEDIYIELVEITVQNFNVYFDINIKYTYKYDYCQYKFINMFMGVSV